METPDWEQQGEPEVLVSTVVSKHPSRDMFAARIRVLGLTAYGNTPDEARGKLTVGLRSFVRVLDENGTLGTRILKALGVDEE